MVRAMSNGDDTKLPSKNHLAAITKKLIVVKKKRRPKLTRPLVKRKLGLVGTSRGDGLPSFRHRIIPEEAQAHNAHDDDPLFEERHDDEFGSTAEEELPSDSLMAIQSLLQTSQGLHIPLLGGGPTTIQVILESQIFQRFEEGHASIINQELLGLIQKNQIRKLSCQGKTTTTGLILTQDYIAAVWDAHQHHQHSKDENDAVMTWFLSNLQHLTESIISKDSISERWPDDIFQSEQHAEEGKANQQQSRRSLDDAIQYLQNIQVLLRDTSTSTSSDERYHLWLPQWGLVLKGWSQARQQLLAFVARGKGGEVSEQNLLKENRNSCVSTKFLLDELMQQGKLRIIQRPFGKFVKRAV